MEDGKRSCEKWQNENSSELSKRAHGAKVVKDPQDSNDDDYDALSCPSPPPTKKAITKSSSSAAPIHKRAGEIRPLQRLFNFRYCSRLRVSHALPLPVLRPCSRACLSSSNGSRNADAKCESSRRWQTSASAEAKSCNPAQETKRATLGNRCNSSAHDRRSVARFA